jgi:hypothetical protein
MTQRGPQGRDRHRRATQLIRRRTVQSPDQIVVAQPTAVLDRLADDQFRKRRPTRDRWPAADRMILVRHDPTVLDSEEQNQEGTPPTCPMRRGLRVVHPFAR